MAANLNPETVQDFSDEWSRFDQSALSEAEAAEIFQQYFAIFPAAALNPESEGFDLGCGSGRWARLVAPRVKRLHCIDPSDAIEVAKRNLACRRNVEFHRSAVDELPLTDGSMDFGYSLGVLHHVPDTLAGLRSCVTKLRPAAPFLLYLYYAFDNRPGWFRAVWRVSDRVRRLIARLPRPLKNLMTDAVAALVYWPLAGLAQGLRRVGIDTRNFPLSFYQDRSFYTMRTDARDRFGTHLEKRFTRDEIEAMMQAAGLKDIHFSDAPPYWCAVGFKGA